MFNFYFNFILKANFFKMASDRVRYSPGWLLGEGFSSEEFAPAWQELLSGVPFSLEVAPAEYYFPLEDECSRKSCSSGVQQIHRERNFPERKLSVPCSGSVLQICRAQCGLML
jgi:hypothetical protein